MIRRGKGYIREGRYFVSNGTCRNRLGEGRASKERSFLIKLSAALVFSRKKRKISVKLFQALESNSLY